MAMANDLRSLGEEIVSAYDNRINLIKEVKERGRARTKEVFGLLKGFATEHRDRSTAEHRDRAKENSELLNGFATEHRERAKENRELADGVSRLLTRFKREGKARAKEVAHMLGNEHQKRTAQVSSMLGEFHRDRAEASAVFKKLLTRMAAKRGVKGT